MRIYIKKIDYFKMFKMFKFKKECEDVKTEKRRKIKHLNFSFFLDNLFECPEEESYNFHLVVAVQLMFLKLKTLPRQPFHIENQ